MGFKKDFNHFPPILRTHNSTPNIDMAMVIHDVTSDFVIG